MCLSLASNYFLEFYSRIGDSSGRHTVSRGTVSEGKGEDRAMDTVTTSTQTDGIGEGRGKNRVFMDMQTKKYFRSANQSEQLFPRLPNEITFCCIVPKLPWRAFHILAAVSRPWRQAIQSHRVRDARIHSCSTDILVVHGHNYIKNDVYGNVERITVYSLRDKLCYNLPPIPGHYRGKPWSCQCLSLDGKIYVIGGAVEVCGVDGSSKKYRSSNSSSKVYVLDLAGASHWKECASMERGRQKFGCGVIDGKIYVFGGTHNRGPVRGAEVYNAQVNAWSPIMPMTSLRFGHKVLTLAEEIVVHGGNCYDPAYTGWKVNVAQDPEDPRYDDIFICNASFMEVYHPVEDEWTVDKPFTSVDDVDEALVSSMFVVQGKVHLMTEVGIYVHDNHADTGISSWKQTRKSMWPRLAPVGSDEDDIIYAVAIVVLNDELSAGVEWYDASDASINGSALLQSKGFGTENDIILWKVVSKCPGDLEDFMCCIQL